MIRIKLAGRTDIDEYFKLSGVFESERLTHTPLLVFITEEDTVTVRIVDKPTDLLSFPDETPVMGQWTGQWRSDFFQFTVGQYRQHLATKLEPLKTAKNVIKMVGPQGGFRHLSYEYVNERGAIAHASTGSKTEAERLETFFAKHNIPVKIEKAR
ncbi:MAG: hypothetical protein J2P21_09245 [Chloracidobacterium sp.]|nr:hypothetical protein [Chloracidobacterium sp.]